MPGRASASHNPTLTSICAASAGILRHNAWMTHLYSTVQDLQTRTNSIINPVTPTVSLAETRTNSIINPVTPTVYLAEMNNIISNVPQK